MRRNVAMLVLVAMLAQSAPVWALDPQSVQAYCDEVKQAAQNAQAKYIQIYQPKQDPGKTFEDATTACLEFINNFNIGFSFQIPSIGDIQGILQRMGQQLLIRACQAAKDQFNKAVNDAMQSVNGQLGDLNQVPGVNVGVQTGAGSGPGVSAELKNDGGSTLGSAAQNAVDRVINFLK